MRTLTGAVLCAVSVSCGGSDTSSAARNSPSTEADGGQLAYGEKTTNAARDIVFNEVAAAGSPEWIEIANKGATDIDLGGYSVADSKKSTNEPKTSAAMKFPEGTTIAAGARIVILTSKHTGGVGPHPQSECLAGGPDACYFATFGVSATMGEPLHLLAPDGSVVVSTATPKTLSKDAGGSSSETQCRLPDLTGDFAPCAPTPGQPNRAP